VYKVKSSCTVLGGGGDSSIIYVVHKCKYRNTRKNSLFVHRLNRINIIYLHVRKQKNMQA